MGYSGPPLYPLIVFCLVIIAVMISVVRPSQKWYLDYWIPPIIGSLVLLVDRTLSPKQLWNGAVVGDESISPYQIVILFMSLAYLCISLDLTGLLAFIAAKVASKAGSAPLALFSAFYALSAAFTVVTSNDIVILTLTPLIIYTCQESHPPTEPLSMLFGQFMAANICSMCLIIGNPTNIIVGDANNLSFLEYSKWMLMPALVATAACYLVVVVKFWGWRKGIGGLLLLKPQGLGAVSRLSDHNEDEQEGEAGERRAVETQHSPLRQQPIGPHQSRGDDTNEIELVMPTVLLLPQPLPLSTSASFSASAIAVVANNADTSVTTFLLVDQNGAIFCAVALVLTLLSLAVLPYFIPVDMYVITLMGAMVVLVRNLLCWPLNKENSPPWKVLFSCFRLALKHQDTAETHVANIGESKGGTNEEEEHANFPIRRGSTSSAHAIGQEEAADVALHRGSASSVAEASSVRLLPTVTDSVVALPSRIIPFVFGMFGLVEGLYQSGWISQLASTLAESLKKGGVGRSLFLMCALTLGLCNVINNQPATILLTRVIISAEFRALPERIQQAAMYGVIIGSNLGANFTLLGALAGIMFHRIVSSKATHLTYFQFSKVCFVVMPPVTVVTLLILWAEFSIF